GATVAIDNRDSVEHNFAIYENEQDADDQTNALVDTPNVAGGEGGEFPADVEEPGDYVFQCDIHPSMRGTATIE
ncbi:MAG: cupredoxin domain-containing protein, partial [Actinomycetota bacterium]